MNDIASVLKHLNQRPIAYYPVYHKICQSIHGAILLSQLMYWFSKKERLYKTNSELMYELNFSEREFKTAKSALKRATFITIKLEGMPAKTYYEIDWDKYLKALISLSNCDNETVPTGQDETVPTGQDETVPTGQDETVPSIYSKIKKTTSETTTENLSPLPSLKTETERYHKRLKMKKRIEEERGERSFLTFVNHIRQTCKPNADEDFYPTIIITKPNDKGESGQLKIDNNGRLYIKYGKNFRDLNAGEAGTLWRWIYEHQDALIDPDGQRVEKIQKETV